MKAKCSNGQTVFDRLRAFQRQAKEFKPTPIPFDSGLGRRPTSADLGVYATPAEFAEHAGLSIEIVNHLVAVSALTHIFPVNDDLRIHVKKGLRDLERMERGPVSN